MLDKSSKDVISIRIHCVAEIIPGAEQMPSDTNKRPS